MMQEKIITREGVEQVKLAKHDLVHCLKT